MKALNRIVFFLLYLLATSAVAQQLQNKQFAANSVLADGRWFKIATIQEGVYKLSYADLIACGATPPFDAYHFRLFGNGGSMLPEKNSEFRFDDLRERSYQVVDGGDGTIDQNDYILFYGESTSKWKYNTNLQTFSHQLNYYADSAYYFFTFDKGFGQLVEMSPLISDAADLSVDCFNEHVFHELDSLNLIKSGKQWLGEVFDNLNPKSFLFTMPDLSDTAGLTARINVMSRCLQQSAFQIDVNGYVKSDTLMPVDGNVNSEYSKSKTVLFSIQPISDSIIVAVKYNKPQESSMGWLNYIELESVRKLIYRGQQIRFRNIQTIGHDVSQFNINNTGNTFHVWTVDDYGALAEMPLTTNGNTTSFKAHTAYLSEFIAFDAGTTLQPQLLGQVPNQNLHGLPMAELVIITPPQFLSQANQIADFHRNNDLMNVAVATTQQVYNEFSSGKQDPSALRDFVRMFYERGSTDSSDRIRYLLLFGDGSYDMKQRIPNNTNVIPTWQTDNSVLPISSFVSDDFFGMLDSNEGDNLNGDIDVGVGRLPVSTVAAADIMVAKTIRYGIKQNLVENSYENGLVSNFDPWRNNVSFIADDEDGNLHFNQTEKMVSMLDSITHKLNVNKIYLDAYKQVHTPSGDKYPEVNADVDKNISRGSLLINYVGHGGEYGLASEGILTFYEIGKYENFYNLPIFVTATCEFSRYDNPELESGGEKILLHPKGGGIAMFTTTRIAFAHSNEIVNRNLLKTTFKENLTEKIRFGDIIKSSKNMCNSGVYKENFTLLGDPALTLAIPQYDVITDDISLDSTSLMGDTLFNNSIITVKGHISDRNGNKQDWFTGKIFPKVYDKPISVTTLANDAAQSYQASFALQQNLLYQGNSTVNNGEFEFSFFVPRDITFGQGLGKIIYYARSDFFDARGIADSLLLKNNGNNNNPDVMGPDINIFMEDLTFQEGDETSSNPMMFAFLNDTSGINSIGLGIGHELVCELDDGHNDPFWLNNSFVLDADKYTSGKITYQFFGLSYGLHKLRLSAWDFLNNNSEKEITFNVKSPSDVELGGIYNYPNPVTDQTTFYIERNMSTEIMSVKISIFDVMGKLCAEIYQNILPGTYRPIEIHWNGNNFNGEPLSKGFYTYKVTLTDANGRLRQKSDKMVIIK
jgi:hypothetical protein